MSETIIRLIFNAVTVLGTAGITILGAIQLFANYNDRKLKENIGTAKENSVGEAALEKLLSGQKDIIADIEAIEQCLGKMQVEIFNEKKELQIRLEKLRDHFEEMTRDYFKILSNK